VVVSFALAAWAAADPVTQPSGDPLIARIVSDISEERIGQIMAKLESFQTRHTLSDPAQAGRGVGAARQWIFDELGSYSPRLAVSFDTHEVAKGGRVWKDVELRNVVAVLEGKSAASKGRWIMIGGHYDSVNLRNAAELRGHPEQAPELPAPGVSDDASGVAAAMECARVLSQYEFDATLVFVAFAGEEQGLVGARAMAKRLKGQQQEIEALLNNDIIGNDTAGNGVSEPHRVLVFSEDPNDSPSRQLARFVRATAAQYVPDMTAEMIFRHDRFGRGGDHTAFNQEGYPAVRFTTASENFAHQHSPSDTLANASVPYTARVVRVNAATAAGLALAPRAPVTRGPSVARGGGGGGAGGNRIGLSRGTGGYDAVMRWDEPGADADLAGFVMVWRSTLAPDWEHEQRAPGGAGAREFVIRNLPIDQLVIGVKAVDRDGHESPASAYVTEPRRPQDPPATEP
jgi:hypothetical protein